MRNCFPHADMYPTSPASWQEVVGHCKQLTRQHRQASYAREQDRFLPKDREHFASHEDQLAAEMQRCMDQPGSKRR